MLSELERLIKEATEGQQNDCLWFVDDNCNIRVDVPAKPMLYMSNWGNAEDSRLIVALRNNAEALVAVVRAAEKADKLLPPHSFIGDAVFYCAMEELRAALSRLGHAGEEGG